MNKRHELIFYKNVPCTPALYYWCKRYRVGIASSLRWNTWYGLPLCFHCKYEAEQKWSRIRLLYISQKKDIGEYLMAMLVMDVLYIIARMI